MDNKLVNPVGNEAKDPEAGTSEVGISELSAPKITCLKEDLLSLPHDTLAYLLSEAVTNHSILASSILPLKYITQAKIRAMNRARQTLSREIESRSSEPGFSPTLALRPFNERSLNTNKFHRLNDLPAELRLMIWKWSFATPRFLKISAGSKKEYRTKSPFKSNTKFPITLYINRESRIETLKHFQLSFITPGQTRGIYCNFETDIICMEYPSWSQHENFLMRLCATNTDEIQRLACSFTETLNFLTADGTKWYDERCFMEKFPALRELFIDVEGICPTVVPIPHPRRRALRSETINFVAHQTKMRVMKNGAWVTSRESGLKPQASDINGRLRAALHKAQRRYPNWKRPTLLYGTVARLELNERVSEVEEAITETVADSEKYLAAMEPAVREAALEEYKDCF